MSSSSSPYDYDPRKEQQVRKRPPPVDLQSAPRPRHHHHPSQRYPPPPPPPPPPPSYHHQVYHDYYRHEQQHRHSSSSSSQQQQQHPVPPVPPPRAKKQASQQQQPPVKARSPSPLGGGAGSGSTISKAGPNKGLRHFSMMVCKKVEEKGVTTYNEVADELVQHVVSERRKEDPKAKCDEKNIRRRVYDALNVLMAMDIIVKEKKDISWNGLPTSARSDLEMLKRERDYRSQEVARKRQALKDLLVQQVCFRNLVNHNMTRPMDASCRDSKDEKDHKIPLPFIVVNTHSSSVIQCNMSRDLTDVMFDFSQPFEINDDNTILKRLGMHKTNRQVLQEMLPEDLLAYADQQGMLDSILVQPDDGVSRSAAPSLGASCDFHRSHSSFDEGLMDAHNVTADSLL